MNRLKIRKAKPEDIHDIKNVFLSWKPDDWDWEYAESYYKDLFENNAYPERKNYVGLVGNKIISVIGYCPDLHEENGICWLGWFYLHKAYIGMSIGQQMLNYIIKELEVKKFRKLFVNTSSDNFYKPAVKLYKKSGFQQEGRLKDYYGRGEDQIILGRNINC